MITGRAVSRRCEMCITKSTAAAARCPPTRAILIEVGQQLARARIENLRPNRHAHHRIRAFAAGSIAAFAVQATTGNMLRVITQVQQRIQRCVCDDPHVAAAAAIPS